MIGRKLLLIQNGQVLRHEEETFLKAPYWEERKDMVVRHIKKHGYVGLVATIRFYVRSSNHLKNKYETTKAKAKEIGRNYLNRNHSEKQEISKFLKVISEYKGKIREIKHRINEEEKGL